MHRMCHKRKAERAQGVSNSGTCRDRQNPDAGWPRLYVISAQPAITAVRLAGLAIRELAGAERWPRKLVLVPEQTPVNAHIPPWGWGCLKQLFRE